MASVVRSTTTGIRTGRPACSAATLLSGMTAAPRNVGLNTTAKGAYCAAYRQPRRSGIGRNAAGNFTCNPDFNVSQLGVVTRWTPVKNLTFSAEVMWFHLDQKMSGSSIFTATAPKPVARLRVQGPGYVLLQVRAQRNF